MIRPTYETFDFRNPDYTSVFRWRADFLAKLRADPQAMAMVRAHYRNAPWDFINDWGITFDPRNVNQGLPPTMPFVLFKRQVECLQFMHRKWQEGAPGLIEKSRDVGLSWLVVGLGCAMCVLNDDFVAGYGSRKEEYVDKLGHPKSLFYKARLFMKYLPREFKAGWSEATSPHMRLEFPATRSVITGEAGDNIGRGDRTSVYYVDESAYLERANLIEASLSATTNCRITCRPSMAWATCLQRSGTVGAWKSLYSIGATTPARMIRGMPSSARRWTRSPWPKRLTETTSRL